MKTDWKELGEVFATFYDIWLKEYFPKESWEIEKTKKTKEISSQGELFENAEHLLNFMEERIVEEHNKSFVTDDLENSVTRYLCACVKYLSVERYGTLLELSDNEVSFKKLCSHRHIGYAFYKEYENTKNFLCTIKSFPKQLYNSMLDYYTKFYGRFADNEEAIERICTHYKKEWEEWDDWKDWKAVITPERIADALESHVRTAGGPNDTGYAYRGIGLIREHIHNIPKQAVLALLCRYEYERYWISDVYRNQIVSIINGSCLDDSEKEYYKWNMLDARYIMHMIEIWIENYKLPTFMLDNEFFYESSLDAKKIPMLNRTEDSNNRKQEVRWEVETQENIVGWRLVLEDKGWQITGYITLLKICLQVQDSSSCSKIELVGSDVYKKCEYEFPFVREDWKMENLKVKNNKSKISKWLEDNVNGSNLFSIINRDDLMSSNSPSEDFHYSILFSNIWINNYRSIKDKTISFDGEFSIKNNNGELRVIDTLESDKIPKSFFGSNIYSLSAIIGKNGSGKTSLIDFIRNNFYQLLYLVNKGLVKFDGNIVRSNLAVPHNVEFMVIFKIKSNDPSMQGKTYYLTNCKHKYSGRGNLTAYKKMPSSSAMTDMYSKTFYFSSMLSDKGVFHIMERNNYVQSLRFEFSEEERKEKNEQFRALEDIRGGYTCNCSVDYAFQQKLSVTSGREKNNTNIDLHDSLLYNWEWIKLVYFLCNVPDEKFKEWFDGKLEKENIMFCRENLVETFSLNYGEGIEKVFEALKAYLWQPIEICGMSSGQYAKLMYLSRLCWSLRVYESDRMVIEKMLKDLYKDDNIDTPKNERKYSEVDFLSLLQDSNTVATGNAYMIFIDEGELYYHPEWQRTFIKTLLDVIGDVAKRDESIMFQIVVTSNSPFIISDIPKNNILFLSEDNQKFESTFGLNIHTLLMNNFFMDGTIGEYARIKIKEISEEITKLDSEENYSLDLESDRKLLMDIQERVNLVGEPLIRRQLQKRLDSIKKKEWAKLQAEDKRRTILEELSKEELLKLYKQIEWKLDSGGGEDHDKD